MIIYLDTVIRILTYTTIGIVVLECIIKFGEFIVSILMKLFENSK